IWILRGQWAVWRISSCFPGGFIFKQWKKQFLHLTSEGKLLLCHDALSLPHQMIQLQSNCEAIVQGKEILDLPKLPSGASRDCCFALILPQNKYLLLLAETPSDCWSDYISLLRVCHFSFASVGNLMSVTVYPKSMVQKHIMIYVHSSLVNLSFV
uniref:PH domain-containing protein n=1 Tax=Oryzias latipes TaxID=8090 RepID=A0A3P9JBK4_ORYLA